MSHRGGRARERGQRARAGTWLAAAVSGVALTACGPGLCPNGLWPKYDRCYIGDAKGGPGDASGNAPRAPWADVGRWAERIHHYQRPTRPGKEYILSGAEERMALLKYLGVMRERFRRTCAAYLESIEGLPVGHPINRHAPPPRVYEPALKVLPDELGIWAVVEIVVRGSDGAIVSLGVVRSSGVDEFDAAALETFERGGPYGPPPPAPLSADGNFYVDWPFFRSPLVACARSGMHPYVFR